MLLPIIKQDSSLVSAESADTPSTPAPAKRRTSAWNILRKDSLKPRANVTNVSDFEDNAPLRPSRTSVSIQEPPSSRKSSIKPGGGKLNLGNVGRRLSMMRRMSKVLAKPEPKEEKIELPQNPRFISLLSVEAQYAALKSYEDLLFERLLEARPEYSGCWQRTPSPPQNLQRLCIKNKETSEKTGDGDEEKNDDDGYDSDSDTASERRSPAPAPVYIPLTVLTKRSVSDINTSLPEMTREKRIMMSYRFQCAFDILDSLKLDQGQHVTSPRIRPLTAGGFDPIRNFSAWHNNWSKEFKVVSRRPPPPQSAAY